MARGPPEPNPRDSSVKRLTLPRVGGTAVVVGVLSWLVDFFLLRRGATPLPVPWTVPASLIIAGAGALALGWMVKQFQEGKRPNLDPLQAARTAMFAQAAAYSGAVLSGVYIGHLVALLPDWSHAPRREVILAAALAALAAVLLSVAGWIAERWCGTKRGDGIDAAAQPESA